MQRTNRIINPILALSFASLAFCACLRSTDPENSPSPKLTDAETAVAAPAEENKDPAAETPSTVRNNGNEELTETSITPPVDKPEETGETKPTEEETHTTPKITFASSIQKDVFVAYCTSCHSATTRKVMPTFDSYAEVKDALDLIKERAVTINNMPPKKRNPPTPAGLPEDVRKVLSDWIEAGAPES